jgi:exodeoxyribonuclease VII large subunit
VVTAIGHEVDETLCDAVADAVAATPSAAAMLVLPDRGQWSDRIEALETRARTALRRRLARSSERLHAVTARLRHPAVALAWSRRRLDVAARLGPALARAVAVRRAHLVHAEARLASLDPRAVLGRGYAIVLGPAGVVTDAAVLRERDPLRVLLHRGAVRASVTGTG